jgi:hypothetical protein
VAVGEVDGELDGQPTPSTPQLGVRLGTALEVEGATELALVDGAGAVEDAVVGGAVEDALVDGAAVVGGAVTVGRPTSCLVGIGRTGLPER